MWELINLSNAIWTVPTNWDVTCARLRCPAIGVIPDIVIIATPYNFTTYLAVKVHETEKNRYSIEIDNVQDVVL